MTIITKEVANHMLYAMDPVLWARDIGVPDMLGHDLFAWQIDALNPDWLRLLLLAARQAGKTTGVLGVLGAHTAKYWPGRPIPVICPAKHQSRLVIDAIKAVMALDKDYPPLVGDAVYEIQTSAGTRVLGMPGTERAVRGLSRPKLIIMDEDSIIPDATYRAVRPMMLGAGTKLLLSGTAHGQRGHFYEQAEHGDPEVWHKMIVRSPWDWAEGRLVDHAPEDRFRAYWATLGWSAWYSDRHKMDPEFVAEEAAEGRTWYSQEHACEFLSATGSLFDTADLEAAHSEEVVPLVRQMTGLGAREEASYDNSVEVLS